MVLNKYDREHMTINIILVVKLKIKNVIKLSLDNMLNNHNNINH